MKDFEKLCPQCMKFSENTEICTFCGKKMNSPQSSPFLQKKLLICNRYLVGNGLEITGEALAYTMFDTVSNRKVYAIEFFPEGSCQRSDDLKTVNPIEHQKNNFSTQKDFFHEYFKKLANLRNINTLCAVYDIVEENNTYYIIFEWIDGVRLDKFVSKNSGKLSWDEIEKMFQPLLNAVSQLHEAHILHLGINPENIFVTEDKKLKLSGFATQSIRTKKEFLNPKLYDGTSALEQYLEIYDCDESTDIYGLCATIFFCLTGEYPPSAPNRKKDESILIEENILKEIPENVVEALVKGLKVYPNDRILSISNLKSEFFGSVKSKIAMIEDSFTNVSDKKQIEKPDTNKNKKRNFVIGVTIFIITLLTLAVFGLGYWFLVKNKNDVVKSEDFSQSVDDGQEKNVLLQTDNEDNILENPLEKAKIFAPKLINLNYKEIKNSLKDDSDYKILLLSEEFSDTISEGKILSQSPSENEEMLLGDTIAVTVSKGSKIKILPNISGDTISEASKKLTKLHLNPISEDEWSDDIEEGIVIDYKDNSAGNEVEYGSDVTFLISKGKK